MQFFVGLHQPSDARYFRRCCISVHRLRRRVGDFQVRTWLLDSGAFSTLAMHGRYPHPVTTYAEQIKRWRHLGQLAAAVTEDYMCEPAMIARTGLSVAEHQARTIDRYDLLRSLVDWPYLLPVLQGVTIEDYLRHLEAWGERLPERAWVGVGSVCKRNGTPTEVAEILYAIKHERPDLRLHGFGLKLTALREPAVCRWLQSADSMAWSFHARKQQRNQNDWREAYAFAERLDPTSVLPLGDLMPRQNVDPLVRSVEVFSTAPLEQAEFALQMATRIVRARRTAPMQTSTLTPAKPKQKRRRRQLLGSAPAAEPTTQA